MYHFRQGSIQLPKSLLFSLQKDGRFQWFSIPVPILIQDNFVIPVPILIPVARKILDSDSKSSVMLLILVLPIL